MIFWHIQVYFVAIKWLSCRRLKKYDLLVYVDSVGDVAFYLCACLKLSAISSYSIGSNDGPSMVYHCIIDVLLTLCRRISVQFSVCVRMWSHPIKCRFTDVKMGLRCKRGAYGGGVMRQCKL